MAETGQEKTVSVDEARWEQSNQIENPVETTVDEKPDDANPEEAVKELADEITAPIKTVPVVEEQSESSEQEAGEPEAAEEKPVIKIETAPADFRFPTTNQTRHCFTRYIEYHRCIAVKGEDAPECEKFGKYYRSLCPSEWVERWNEQRENGTFPGPL